MIKIEEIFQFLKYAEEDKMKFVAIKLKGDAEVW